MFTVLFFLSWCFCQGDLMPEDKTRHQEKWVQAVVRMVTNAWKGGLLLACFWAWLKVWVDGPESTKESALADDSWPGLAAMVCFLWLSDLCVTQTARGTPASECWSSSPYVLSLSPLLFSPCLPSFLNTWQKVTGRIGQLEAVRLNLDDSMVCVEDQRKKIVLEKRKFVERQLNGFEEETNKLADRVTAALVICEEHMSNYHTLLELMSSKAWAKNSRKEIAKWLGRRGCTLAMFWNRNRSSERRWRVDYEKRDDEVWDWWKSTDGETNTKMKPNGNYGRDKTEVWEVELFNLPMVLLKVVQKTVVVPHIQYIAVCDITTSSPNLECSETVEDLPNAIQR